jgi:tRNA(Ile)-lysidine synthase
MLDDFIKYIEANNLIARNEKILGAISGGIDSMVLAALLLRCGYLSGIAHCNFCLRGKESDKDEELVRRYAAKNKVPFFSVRFNTKDLSREKGISIEMAARELRYAWFERTREENGFDKVAVAHNLNDNIETFILNLVRGTGIAGLTGMNPLSGTIIRPLLFSSRKSIEQYCSENKILYREDRSNADTKFIRNKIRHKIIPVLKEINPSIESTINETAERMTDTYAILSACISGIRESVITKDHECAIVKIEKLKPYLENKTMVYEIFKPYGICGNIMDLINIVNGKTGGQIFTDTHRIVRDRDNLHITELSSSGDETYIYRNLAELKKCPFLDVGINSDMTGFVIPADPSFAVLDFKKVKFPVVLRRWTKGDIFYPFGMTGKKKLSDYFVDRKFSRLKKEKTFIMESGGKIAWIVGERIDNRFRINNMTKKALILKIIPQVDLSTR